MKPATVKATRNMIGPTTPHSASHGVSLGPRLAGVTPPDPYEVEPGTVLNAILLCWNPLAGVSRGVVVVGYLTCLSGGRTDRPSAQRDGEAGDQGRQHDGVVCEVQHGSRSNADSDSEQPDEHADNGERLGGDGCSAGPGGGHQGERKAHEQHREDD